MRTINTHNIELVIFDLDGTLTVSKSRVDKEMSSLLSQLLAKKKVAVISGGSFNQFKEQFLVSLATPSNFLRNLFLFPTSGSSFYRYEHDWINVYNEQLSPDERTRIISVFPKAIQNSGIVMPTTLYGAQIEDRGSQVTFSALGQNAPIEQKAAWDPDQKKRLVITQYLERALPEFEIRIGGTTSIDITRKGIDKKYGILQMEKHLGIPRAKMLFIGDALFPGGNDYAAIEAGVEIAAVSGPAETKEIIRNLIRL